MKGGLSIVGPAGNECTSGFIVRRTLHNGALAVLTAGHCIAAEPMESIWKHNNDRFGETKYQTWSDGENDDKLGDVGLIELDVTEADALAAANKIFVFNGSSNHELSITSYVPNGVQTEGTPACIYGTNSNNSECGLAILDYDERHSSPRTINGQTVTKWILHTNELPIDMDSGDSGGPVYRNISSGVRYAMGTHVHSTNGAGAFSWYTPYQWGQTAYLNETPDYYTLCIDANC
jgi:hypothetical protein